MEDCKSCRRFYVKVASLVPVIVGVVLFIISNPALAGEVNLLKITDLRCEYLSDLQSLDHQSPNFGWVLESKERGQKQTAYQVVVSDSDGNLMWNSEKVESPESSHVKYAGKQLKSSSDYYWKVRVWDKNDKPGKYTKQAHFATAFMDSKEWKAKWIGRGPVKEPVVRWGTNFEAEDLALIKDMEPDYQSTLLRKEVVFNKSVTSAKVHICGLGLYELYINGSKIGKTREHVPLKTDYSRQVLYNSYDISDKLGKGSNVIGVMLGNGWFNPQKKYWDWRMQWWGSPKAIVQVEITYKDGSKGTVISDQSWKTSPGPVLSSCIYDGEIYDATLEQVGWDKIRGGPLLISTAFYYYDAKVDAESAKVLGKTEDAKKYAQLAVEIAQAFNNVFQTNKRIGYKYGENTQCESAAPLFLGIAPENTKSTVVKNRIDDIEAHDMHLTTGFYGTKWVMEALPLYGRADIAYQLLTQKTYPGWGDMTKGRTTVSETWKGTGTNNHGGLGGTPNLWIFKTLLGINADSVNPGFKKIIIKPYIPDDMTYVKGSTRTIKGLVESSWEKDNGKVILKVSIPANTTALVCIPIANPSKVKEGNNEAGMSQGVSYLGKENNKVNYEIESGQYRFIFDGVTKN